MASAVSRDVWSMVPPLILLTLAMAAGLEFDKNMMGSVETIPEDNSERCIRMTSPGAEVMGRLIVRSTANDFQYSAGEAVVPGRLLEPPGSWHTLTLSRRMVNQKHNLAVHLDGTEVEYKPEPGNWFSTSYHFENIQIFAKGTGEITTCPTLTPTPKPTPMTTPTPTTPPANPPPTTPPPPPRVTGKTPDSPAPKPARRPLSPPPASPLPPVMPSDSRLPPLPPSSLPPPPARLSPAAPESPSKEPHNAGDEPLAPPPEPGLAGSTEKLGGNVFLLVIIGLVVALLVVGVVIAAYCRRKNKQASKPPQKTAHQVPAETRVEMHSGGAEHKPLMDVHDHPPPPVSPYHNTSTFSTPTPHHHH